VTAAYSARTAPTAVPAFVERELREFLTCGVMARGFAVTQ
jgi:hypothetical protein